METLDIVKSEHGAGGYTLSLTKGKGNTKFGERKKKAIIEALKDRWTEGVYITTNNVVKRQLLNGSAQFLEEDKEEGMCYFAN